MLRWMGYDGNVLMYLLIYGVFDDIADLWVVCELIGVPVEV